MCPGESVPCDDEEDFAGADCTAEDEDSEVEEDDSILNDEDFETDDEDSMLEEPLLISEAWSIKESFDFGGAINTIRRKTPQSAEIPILRGLLHSVRFHKK